jgi:HEAT repeat protein
MDECTELLKALASADPKERDKAAMCLRDIAEAAVRALLRAIQEPANKNNRGTLAYALMVFNCSGYFSELFSLATTSNYEVQCHALSILQEQKFTPTTPELREAEQQLNELQQRQDTPSGTELLCSELREVISQFQDDEFQLQHRNASAVA